ncbi:MAG: replication-associated recombination protein A [Oscillospiraceae bacterium]|nr:replication-associated recombination protein A [Oscillospiraceae bacterium]
MKKTPLAYKLRPASLKEVAGQSHLIGEGKPLRRIVESSLQSGNLPCMLFYGPSGVGKTTIANIIAAQTNMTLCKLNGTSCSTADIKEVIARAGSAGGLMPENGILLYLDEIQYLSKKQQQTLLEFIENGDITLIAATTENPYFYVYGAILSRCTVFEFKSLTADEIVPTIQRAFALVGRDVRIAPPDSVIDIIAQGCGGDVRKAINAAELCAMIAEGGAVTEEIARQLVQKSGMRYDRSGDEHYDTLSAFHKSMRGSDENAALHYLARLIEADDMAGICRRLLCVAAEDVGLAYPNAIAIVKACVDSALQLGFPEARLPLAQAAILLATSPKSNSVLAVDAAIADVRAGRGVGFPRQLQNVHCDGADNAKPGQGYKYPHDYPGNYVAAQYLPDSLAGRVYYAFGENKHEQAALAFRRHQRGEISDKNPTE